MGNRMGFTSGLWERKMSDDNRVRPSYEIADPFPIISRLFVSR